MDEIIMTNKKCQCCDSIDILCCHESNSNRLLHCLNCGVYFFMRSPTDLELRNYYRSTYSNIHQKQLFDLLKKNYDNGFYKNEIKNILSYHDQDHINNLKILDYGSGYGFFLNEAKNCDIDAYGIEYDEEVAKHNEKEFGIKMLTETQLEKIEDNTFDIIRANHCLEHLPDPIKVLSILFNKLKEKGIITISSPCFSENIVQQDSMKLYDIVYPEHLYYFTHTAIQTLLEKIGFQVEINITQFASPSQSLRLLGINQESTNMNNNSNFKNFQQIMELEPFFAGANLFIVGRKKKNMHFGIQKKKENNYADDLHIQSLDKYEQINGDNISDYNITRSGQKNSTSRGFYFELSAENISKWNILFPFKIRNFKKGIIYISGTILTLNSLDTRITLLDKNKNQIASYNGQIQNNHTYNFMIRNEYCSNNMPSTCYVCVSGIEKGEFFMYDLIVTERSLEK